MEKIIRTMMDLIEYEVCGKKSFPQTVLLSDDELVSLYKLSKVHDLAHLAGDALIKNNLIKNEKIKEAFKKQIIMAVFRYEKIKYELTRLRALFNEEKIPFVPLKGSVLRSLYPEPWMRTSCDIDILIHEEQVGETARIIIDKLGYTLRKNNYHDISLVSESNVHLELHFSIKEHTDGIDALLQRCWDYASATDGFEYKFSNEFLIFHQYAHASYHFLKGGCGIRPFLDVYLLDATAYDQTVLDKMLDEAGIKKFSEKMLKLANVWFGNSEHDSVTEKMEQFVISGGVFGSTKNSVAVSQQREKGRIGYILHRIWIPYDMLCGLYPRLTERRYLQPLYEVKRWFRIFDPDARRRKKHDLDAIKNLSDETSGDVNFMLKELDLI